MIFYINIFIFFSFAKKICIFIAIVRNIYRISRNKNFRCVLLSSNDIKNKREKNIRENIRYIYNYN